MTMRKKIEVACTLAGVSQASLARALNISPQTFNARLKICKFSVISIHAPLAGCDFNGDQQ